MAISSADAQAMMDNIAKAIIDMVATEGSVSGIQTGMNTMLAHVANLGSAANEYDLLAGFEQVSANVTTWITQEDLYNAILDCFGPGVAVLEKNTAGLAAFMAANGPLYCDPHYLDAHNRAANLRPSIVSLAAWQAFGAAVANMGQINVSGATTGTFVAGTNESASYGNATLSIFNAGAGNIGASSTAVQVTYSKYNASGVLQTGQTASATITSGSVPGTAVSLGATGVAVTGITVTSGGNSGDSIGVKGTLLRAVAYS